MLGLAAVVWVATMGQLLKTEVLAARDSPDVRDVVASARLTREHASARYVIRAGATVLGTLASSVSGSRDEEQLAHVVEGELHSPVRARLKVIVVSNWDRRPERLAVDLDLAGSRHRVEGVLVSPAGPFRVRHLAPGVSPDEAPSWDLDEVPRLAPGPLPMPELASPGNAGTRHGELTDPSTGRPLTWMAHPATWQSITLAGRQRRARRQELVVGDATVTAFTEESGFPLRLELPGGIVLELVEESR